MAASGRLRRWIRPSSTSEPAVSASRDSSRSEFSALARVPSVHTPISTTRSSRSARYSTSLTSCSSVDRPATRRSACRSSRSSSPVPGWNCGSAGPGNGSYAAVIAILRSVGQVGGGVLPIVPRLRRRTHLDNARARRVVPVLLASGHHRQPRPREHRMPGSDGIEVTGPHGDRYDEILTPEALALVARLQRELGPRRAELLARQGPPPGGAVGRRHAGLPAGDPGDPRRRVLAGRAARARAWSTAGWRSPGRPTGR